MQDVFCDLKLTGLASSLCNALGVNSPVTTNILIGKTGNTGNSDAAHLHISIIIDGSTGTPTTNNTIDPMFLFPHVEFGFDDKA